MNYNIFNRIFLSVWWDKLPNETTKVKQPVEYQMDMEDTFSVKLALSEDNYRITNQNV